jgi:hypothetical protein
MLAFIRNRLIGSYCLLLVVRDDCLNATIDGAFKDELIVRIGEQDSKGPPEKVHLDAGTGYLDSTRLLSN